MPAGGRRRGLHEPCPQGGYAARPDCAGVLSGVIRRDSRPDIMVQLADTVARAAHKRHRENPHFRGWFESLAPRLDAGSPKTPAL